MQKYLPLCKSSAFSQLKLPLYLLLCPCYYSNEIYVKTWIDTDCCTWYIIFHNHLPSIHYFLNCCKIASFIITDMYIHSYQLQHRQETCRNKLVVIFKRTKKWNYFVLFLSNHSLSQSYCCAVEGKTEGQFESHFKLPVQFYCRLNYFTFHEYSSFLIANIYHMNMFHLSLSINFSWVQISINIKYLPTSINPFLYHLQMQILLSFLNTSIHFPSKHLDFL